MPRFFIIIVIDFSMILGISKGGEKKRNISCPDTRISKLHQTRSFLFWNDEKTIVKRIIGRRRLFPIFSRKRKGKEREREKDASSHVYVFCKTTQKFCLNENRSFSKGHAILRNGFYWKKRETWWHVNAVSLSNVFVRAQPIHGFVSIYSGKASMKHERKKKRGNVFFFFLPGWNNLT